MLQLYYSPDALALLSAWGVSLPGLLAMFGNFQQMKFYVRTAYGDSEGYFGATPDDSELPLGGVFQGKGSGPSVWSAVSAVLVTLLHARNMTCHLRLPLSGKTPPFGRLPIC